MNTKINWGVVVFDSVLLLCATLLSIYFNNGEWMWLIGLCFFTGSILINENNTIY